MNDNLYKIEESRGIMIVKCCFRAMEYIPFVGIIPGALRIAGSFKKHDPNSRIHKVATKCLKPSLSEKTRGIVSAIPILNTCILIPTDILWPFVRLIALLGMFIMTIGVISKSGQ